MPSSAVSTNVNRSRNTLLVAFAVIAVLAGLAGPAAARDKVHRGSFWAWTGPANWTAVYGKNGITVSSPSGTSAIDLGFSSVLCAPGSTVRQSTQRFFARQRSAIARNGVRFTRVGRIFAVAGLGPNYFRQVSRIRFRLNGVAIRGQVSLDYQVPDPIYCYQNSRTMYAPANGFRARLRQLNRIYSSFAYFGPGAPIPPRS